MRIQSIEIINYKAFLGPYKINVGGKNLFIYGENGSGKSSLYYALKDFSHSSLEDINLADLENIFVATGEKDKTEVNIIFNPDNSQKHDIDWRTLHSQDWFGQISMESGRCCL